MKNSVRSLVVLLGFFAAFLISGCGQYWVDPYVKVKGSDLDWLEIHYYKMNQNPVMRYDVYLSGAGYVEFKKGRSQLVTNDFAKRDDDPHWASIRTLRKDVDKKHVKDIMQNLVNHGLLDDVRFRRSVNIPTSGIARFIAFRCNISNYAYAEKENIFETDPDLAQLLFDVIWEFNDPTK